MAKRKKRRAPSRSRAARPKADGDPFDESQDDEDDELDEGGQDEQDDADDAGHDEPADAEDEAEEEPAAAQPDKPPKKGKRAKASEPAKVPVGPKTRAAPENAGLVVMAIVFSLMVLGIVAAAFMD